MLTMELVKLISQSDKNSKPDDTVWSFYFVTPDNRRVLVHKRSYENLPNKKATIGPTMYQQTMHCLIAALRYKTYTSILDYGNVSRLETL